MSPAARSLSDSTCTVGRIVLSSVSLVATLTVTSFTDTFHSMSIGDHTRVLILFTIWCLPGIAFLSDAHSHIRTEPTQLEHTAAVYHELARRDIANGPLMDALSKQTDVGEISRKLQLKDVVASTLNAAELETIKQSMLKMVKYMLVDLAPPVFLESRLSGYYGSVFTTSAAQSILDSYDEVGDRPERALLNASREAFWEESFQDLMTEARSWSRSFQIPSGGMLPTLVPGDHIVVNKGAYRDATPQRGDVIVFKYPKDETKHFMQRVIGLPGDVIEVRDQVIYLNRAVLSESYIQHIDTNILAANARDNHRAVTVPSDSYFVLGDNRESSLDSRFWGYVTKDKILGKAEWIYLSIDRTSKAIRWNRSGLPVR